MPDIAKLRIDAFCKECGAALVCEVSVVTDGLSIDVEPCEECMKKRYKYGFVDGGINSRRK